MRFNVIIKNSLTCLMACSVIPGNTIYALEEKPALRAASASTSPVSHSLLSEFYKKYPSGGVIVSMLEEYCRIMESSIFKPGQEHNAKNIDREKLLEKFIAYGRLCEKIENRVKEIYATGPEIDVGYIKAVAHILNVNIRKQDFYDIGSFSRLIMLIEQKSSEGRIFGEWISEEVRKIENLLAGNSLDIVAIVPFYNEGDTIGGVIETIRDGLSKYFGDKKSLIIDYGEYAVNAGNLRSYLKDKINKFFSKITGANHELETAATEMDMENQLTGLADEKRAIKIIDLLPEDALIERLHPGNVARRINSLDNISVYTGLKPNENRGKGYSLLAGMIIALYFGARGYVCYDADLHKNSIKPEWIKLHLESILENKADMVIPFYRRHPLDGTITNNLVFPLMEGLYKKHIRQPIGGEYGFGIEMMSRLLTDPSVLLTDKATWGTDSWFVSMGVASSIRIKEAFLGVKDHNSSDKQYEMQNGSIINSVELMFMQVVNVIASEISDHVDDGYLLEVMDKDVAADIEKLTDEHITPVNLPEIEVCWEEKVKAFQNGFEVYDKEGIYRQVLSPQNYAEVSRLAGMKNALSEEFSLDPGLWASVVYDFLLAYRFGDFDIANKLLPALMRIYQARSGSFARDYAMWIAEGRTVEEAFEMAEEVFIQQARIFNENSKDFLKRWKAQQAAGKTEEAKFSGLLDNGDEVRYFSEYDITGRDIKLIVSDFDRTLSSDPHLVPDEIIDEVERFLEAGGIFAVLTGASTRRIHEVFSKRIRPCLRKNVILMCEFSSVISGYSEKGRHIIYNRASVTNDFLTSDIFIDKVIKEFSEKLDLNVARDNDFNPQVHDILIITEGKQRNFTISYEISQKAKSRLRQAQFLISSIITENNFYKSRFYMFTTSRCIDISLRSKAEGMDWILGQLGINPEEVAVIGDSLGPTGNDRPMLTRHAKALNIYVGTENSLILPENLPLLRTRVFAEAGSIEVLRAINANKQDLDVVRESIGQFRQKPIKSAILSAA
jgi:glucosylglycerate synthase